MVKRQTEPVVDQRATWEILPQPGGKKVILKSDFPGSPTELGWTSILRMQDQSVVEYLVRDQNRLHGVTMRTDGREDVRSINTSDEFLKQTGDPGLPGWWSGNYNYLGIPCPPELKGDARFRLIQKTDKVIKFYITNLTLGGDCKVQAITSYDVMDGMFKKALLGTNNQTHISAWFIVEDDEMTGALFKCCDSKGNPTAILATVDLWKDPPGDPTGTVPRTK